MSNTHCNEYAHSLAVWLGNQQEDTLSPKDIETVNRDLLTLTSKYHPLIADVKYIFCDDMLEGYCDKIPEEWPKLLAPYFPLPAGKIDPVHYSRYRAWHDVLHAILCRDFTFLGELSLWYTTEHIAESIGLSPITVAYLRHDILYNNAIAEHNKFFPSKAIETRLVLKEKRYGDDNP